MKSLKEYFAVQKKKKQLKKLREQIINGNIFLRIINDELKRIDRNKRKRIIEDMMKKGRLNDEIITACEIKAEYLLKMMEGQLKFYKKKKADAKKQNKAKVAQAKKGATKVNPTVKIKPDATYVNGVKQEPKDGKEFYNELKKKEKEGKLPEQKKESNKKDSK